MSCSSLALVVGPGGLDDFLEVGQHGGAADEEAVDVGLADELATVGGLDRAAVEDSGLAGVLRGDVLGEPLADRSVRLLGLLLGGDLTSANSPNRLISDDHTLPIAIIEYVSNRLELPRVDVVSLAGFALKNS